MKRFHLILLSTLFLSLTAYSSPEICSPHLLKKAALEKLTSKERRTLTQVEAALEAKGIGKDPARPQEVIEAAIKQLKNIDQELASKVESAYAIRQSQGATALRLNLSELDGKMIDFINGPYYRRVQNAGISEPFMEIRKIDSYHLWIRHLGDELPMIVRWHKEVDAPFVRVMGIEDLGLSAAALPDQTVSRLQVLNLPESMNNRSAMGRLEREVNQLISGSYINNYFAASSAAARANRVIHNVPLISDRPTQAEFRAIRQAFDEDPQLQSLLESLLFVAPTGSGKTRILAINAEAQMDVIAKANLQSSLNKRKATVLMANTVDLINQLAEDVAEQIALTRSLNGFRIIQWGGGNTEPGDLKKLIHFIDQSEQPVLLVTSVQTIASRVKGDEAMDLLFSRTMGLSIDEAHNATSPTFKRVIAAAQRQKKQNEQFLFLGTTATPMNRTILTETIFQHVYYASKDTPKFFVRGVTEGFRQKTTTPENLIWVTMQDQIAAAARKGEINAPDPVYMPNNVFKRASKGTHSNVHPERFYKLWTEEIESQVALNGPGIIHCFPRDAKVLAPYLSKKTGKNFLDISRLSANRRIEAFEAYRKGEPFRGEPIYALVGPMREGLDFPYAGWMVVAKRYIGFPENIQAPGRVFRIAPGKPVPKVFFLAEEDNRRAYQAIQDLVMRNAGRLPTRLAQGRGFSNSRRLDSSLPLSNLSQQLNVAMELFYRKNPELARRFADQNPNRLSPDIVNDFHQALNQEFRLSGNAELAQVVHAFFARVMSYKFYQGNLEKTWNFTDQLLKAKRAGSSKGMSDYAKAILKDPAEMKRVEEFRTSKNWLGANTRGVVERYDYQPSGVYQLAEVINATVRNYGDETYKLLTSKDHHLNEIFTEALSVSPTGLYSRLSHRAKAMLDSLFIKRDEVGIEAAFNAYIKKHKQMPSYYFERLSENLPIRVEDKNSHFLFQRFRAALESGTLRVEELSPESLKMLSSSRILDDAAQSLIIEIRRQMVELIDEIGLTQYRKIKLSFNDIASDPEVGGVLRIIDRLAKKGDPKAKQLKQSITEVLKTAPLADTL